MRVRTSESFIPPLLQSRMARDQSSKQTAIKLFYMRRLGTVKRRGDMLNTERQTKPFELIETKYFFVRDYDVRYGKDGKHFSALGRVSWK
jgi:hypothetical protein